MKIKRFNNLWTMGLIISAALLGVIYLLKIFVPEFVIEVAHIDSIVAIGHYIDGHKWAWYLASAIVSFVSYYLICCACCKKKSLNSVEIIIVVSTILILFIIREFLPNQYTVCNMSSLVLLPLLMKGDFKTTVIVFMATNFLQSITLEIRNLAVMATALILTIDFYILEFLLYSYFNYKERSIENGIS